jgi:glycerophosphoryl diester phosphodiesterase
VPSGAGMMGVYKIVAHRGASAYEPENTIRAIRRAIEFGADMVEVDAHSTRDGHLVVIHDAEVDHTTNGKGKVRDSSLQAIRKLNAGKGEKVPTLHEVLRVAKDEIGVMIEVKAIGIEKPILELIRNEEMLEQVIITSFMSDVVGNIKKLEPRIRTGQIFSWKIPNIVKKAIELKATIMVPAFELVNREMVQELHGISIPIYAWTVDDPYVAKRLIEIGVDGIITNKPDLMSEK